MATESEWDLAEKVLMRELTRINRASGKASLVQAATDAANAALAAKMRNTLESGKTCGMESKLYTPGTTAIDWQALACFGRAFGTLSEAEQLDLIARLEGNQCFALALKYGTHFAQAVPACPQEVRGDSAYASKAAIEAASWDPTNPGAGDTYVPSLPAPPGGQPPGGEVPPPPAPWVTETTLTQAQCVSMVDSNLTDLQKQSACVVMRHPAATPEQLELYAQLYDQNGYPATANLIRRVIIERAGGDPVVPGNVPGTQPPAFACDQSRLDAFLTSEVKASTCDFFGSASREQLLAAVPQYQAAGWVKTAAYASEIAQSRGSAQPPGAQPPGAQPPAPSIPGIPADLWQCTPFPQCLATKWPQGLPTPCTPWPDCVCQPPVGPIPGCPTFQPPGQLPGTQPTGTQPGTQPVGAEEKKEAWYTTTGGKLAIAAGGVTAIALLVGLASR